MIIKRDSMLTAVLISGKPKWIKKYASLRVFVEGELVADIACGAVAQGKFPISPPIYCKAGTEINGEFELTRAVKGRHYLDFGLVLNPILSGAENVTPRAIRRKYFAWAALVGGVAVFTMYLLLTYLWSVLFPK